MPACMIICACGEDINAYRHAITASSRGAGVCPGWGRSRRGLHSLDRLLERGDRSFPENHESFRHVGYGIGRSGAGGRNCGHFAAHLWAENRGKVFCSQRKFLKQVPWQPIVLPRSSNKSFCLFCITSQRISMLFAPAQSGLPRNSIELCLHICFYIYAHRICA